MISYRSNSRYPYKRSVRSSSYYQPRKYNSGYPETYSKYQQLIASYHLHMYLPTYSLLPILNIGLKNVRILKNVPTDPIIGSVHIIGSLE